MRAVSLKPVGILVFPLLALTDEPKIFTRKKKWVLPCSVNVPREMPVPYFLSSHSSDTGREDLYPKESQVTGMQSFEAAPTGMLQLLGLSLAYVTVLLTTSWGYFCYGQKGYFSQLISSYGFLVPLNKWQHCSNILISKNLKWLA